MLRGKCVLRRGVSLLEVLFSIGIVAIGLLGVMSLLVVGGRKTSQGAVADAADRVGRSAVRVFDVRGMRDPTTWTMPLAPHAAYGPSLAPNVAYCLDPVFVAVNGTAYPPNTFPSSGPAAHFPYFTPASLPGPRMVRMSIIQNAPSGNPLVVTPVSRMVAEMMCMCEDGLITNNPDDKTMLSRQVFAVDNVGQPVKRAFNGNLSWMAQIVPKDMGGSDQYTLYVVVFDRRDLAMPAATPSVDDPEAERVVDVVSMAGAATASAGGEVKLTVRSGRPVVDLKLSSGQWLMLAGQKTVPWGAGTVIWPEFAWYKVVSSHEVQPGDDYVYATITGRDWDFAGLQTQAVIVTDVVAVYEKTIRLERSSMWSMN